MFARRFLRTQQGPGSVEFPSGGLCLARDSLSRVSALTYGSIRAHTRNAASRVSVEAKRSSSESGLYSVARIGLVHQVAQEVFPEVAGWREPSPLSSARTRTSIGMYAS